MKFKIDGEGWLRIERAGEMKKQECPFRGGYCGDWCPHFGEPGKSHGADGLDIWDLHLTCGMGRYITGTLVTDERGKG